MQPRKGASPISAFSCCRVFVCDSFCLWCLQRLAANWEISVKLRHILSCCQNLLLLCSDIGMGFLALHGVCQKSSQAIPCRPDTRSALCWKPLDQYAQTFERLCTDIFPLKLSAFLVFFPSLFLFVFAVRYFHVHHNSTQLPSSVVLHHNKNANQSPGELRKENS